MFLDFVTSMAVNFKNLQLTVISFLNLKKYLLSYLILYSLFKEGLKNCITFQAHKT